MTYGAFLEYILANECHVYQKTENYYKIRKNGTHGSKNMSGLPFNDSQKQVRPFTVCQICHNLDIPVPDEVKEAEEIIAQIRKKHLNDKN